jgi:hypothetical protein
MMVGLRDSNGTWIENHFAGSHSNSRAGVWEEVAGTFTPDGDEVKVQVKFYRHKYAPQHKGIELRNLYFGEGVSTTATAARKTVSTGAVVSVDEFGNFTVNGEPFFPIAIYSQKLRDDWGIYKTQGFNTTMRSAGASDNARQKAHDAGLMTSFNITGYLTWTLDDSIYTINPWASDLAGRIQEVDDHMNSDSTSAWSDFLMWYWDNENHLLSVPFEIADSLIALIDSVEVDLFGSNAYPLYILQGNYGVARAYNRYSDVTGSYIRNHTQRQATQGTNGLIMLRNIEGQTTPVSFMQINDTEQWRLGPDDLRVMVYRGLIAGAKALGIFKDFYHPDREWLGCEYSRWWSEMPALSNEIQQLMPVIRAPIHTDWGVKAEASGIVLGTRELGETKYVLAVNTNGYDVTTGGVFDPEPEKMPRKVYDYFTGRPIQVQRKRAEFTIPAHDTRVFVLE